VEEGGRLAGIAIGTVEPEISCQIRRRFGYMWLILVHPDHRGRGVGKRLFNEFLGLSGRYLDLLEIGTQIANHPANSIYQGAGCAVMGHCLTFHRHDE
jgi:ribosomal protein S18 acetylase RimI-like enzyme